MAIATLSMDKRNISNAEVAINTEVIPMTKRHAASYHPLSLFKEWFADIEKLSAENPMATAVCLSTASSHNIPSARMVLLKKYDESGFVIYTNMESRKGRELQENPQAALCFYWQHLGKQVRIEGKVERVSNEEADAYFNSRPLNSRIGAWASEQSRPMKHKHDLMKRVAKYTALWAVKPIERPPYWTGVRIVPDYFEFLYEAPNQPATCRQFILENGKWHESCYLDASI